MSPLFLLVLAHSPNRSAAESVLTVSTPWARESEGPAHARNRQTARKVLAVFVMSALYPRRVDSESLHDVGELANIAGPRVGPQQLQRVTPPAWFCLTGPLQKLL